MIQWWCDAAAVVVVVVVALATCVPNLAKEKRTHQPATSCLLQHINIKSSNMIVQVVKVLIPL